MHGVPGTKLFTIIYLSLMIAVTSAGGLNILYPEFDIVNYFRPWLVLASGPALYLHFSSKRHPVLRSIGLLIFVANVVLLLHPIFANTPGHHITNSKPLKIISVNVWAQNQSIERVATFLEKERADIVVLQEVYNDHLKTLRRDLRKIYPFILTCDCRGLVLLSRFRWQVSGGNPLTSTKPAMIWARFAKPGRGTYRVVGVHTAYPLRPNLHTKHLKWLATRLPFGERLIVAGDFNATPWSTHLRSMAANYRLRRALTFAASWPSQFLLPLVLIDNIYVSGLFDLRASRVGPHVGSDHRPIIVEIALPS